MRRTLRILIAGAIIAAPFSFASAATTQLNVYAKNAQGTAMGNVAVIAVNFGMNGPSTYTAIGNTDASGNATLSLENGLNYNLFYSSQGFAPTMKAQFNNPDPGTSRFFWPTGTTLYSTVTLTALTGEDANVGRIELEFTNATPNKVLSGGVNSNVLQEPSAFGMVRVDALGDGVLSVDNVPYAAANSYNIGLYDPEKNKGVGKSVQHVLSADYPVISYVGALNEADFDQSIAPPRIENTASKNTDGGSNLSVEGVVRSTDTNWVAIPHNGINFRSCRDNPWAQVDENGAFQLYNLTPGVTYYTEAYGGCTWSQSGPGDCYEPYRSPALTSGSGGQQDDLCLGAAPKGINDFVYLSSNSLQTVHIKLNRVAKNIGKIKVYINSSSGYPIPNANVSVQPDGSGWATGSHCSITDHNDPQYYQTINSNPGFANSNVSVSATGYALIDGLPSGNYMIYVWTPFTQNSATSGGPSSYNSGSDGSFGDNTNWAQAHCGTDDFRVHVDTADIAQPLHVYNVAGTDMGLSSITVSIAISTTNTAVVQGALRFPYAVDLSASPIMLTLQPQCDMGNCQGQGNFTVVPEPGATVSDHYTYSIPVASAAAYYMNVTASGWGRINKGGGDNNVSLNASTYSIVNMNFNPAGTITGTLYKPDGTVYVPGTVEWVYVNVNNNNGYSNAQVGKDGTFTMNDVLPGINTIMVGGGGTSGFSYALPSPTPQVNVTAGNTSTINLNLVNATYLNTSLDMSKIPDTSFISQGYNSLLGFSVVTLPAGTVLKGSTINELLNKGGGDMNDIRYGTTTAAGQDNPCGGSNGWPGGFCAGKVPSPAAYDMYMMHNGNFDDSSKSGKTAAAPRHLSMRQRFSAAAIAQADMPYPHFTLISSSRNVIVDSAHANAVMRTSYDSPMSTPSTGVLVDMTPATDQHLRGNTKLKGSVTAVNFFRQSDYEGTGGDFNKFVDYLPMVVLYDANGGFAAAGMVIPPPTYISAHDANNDFDRTFAAGYQPFKDLLDGGKPYSYEIRSLAPNTCYTEVLTTPNYPPYQTLVCTGESGTTKTMDLVDFDTVVGAGAILQGIVRTTDTLATPIPDVAVEISGEGLDSKSAVTASDGGYRFEGLPSGEINVKFSASGYALGEAEAELSGTNTVTLISSLTAAGGAITGTVYSQKMPFAKVQPGAEIYAYDDTYNGLNTTLPLPLIKTVTGSDGTYKLTGLVSGDVYKVFLRVPGKYTLNQSTTATNGLISGLDFTMMAKPLDIEIFARKGLTEYEFTMLNPKDFKEGFAKWSESPYSAVGGTTLNLQEQLDGLLRGSIPLGSLIDGKTYVLHAEAISYSNQTVTKELMFGKDYKGNSEQAIDAIILGDDSDDGKGKKNNEAAIDQGGDDPSALVVPPGVITPLSAAAVPVCTFKGEDKDSTDPTLAAKVDALGADAFAGNLYTVALSSVTINEDKGLQVTLAYDKSNSSLTDLGVASYNSTTQEWTPLDAVATVNPVKGTVKVKLKQLASVLSVKNKGPRPTFASFNGREYAVRPQAAGSGSWSATLAVIKPSVAGTDVFSGSKLKVFNYPNPFNLKDKAISNLHGATLPGSTYGTVIHVEVPAGNGGPGHIRIYTLAGELVRDLSADFTAGSYNYVVWDGRNKGGQEVANGVYYGIIKMTGKKPKLKDATFKMAVIK